MWVLAYSAACSTCRGAARAVAQATDGRIEVASLLDPRVVAVVTAAGLSADRPTLLDPDSPARVLQGPALGWKMARLLGLRPAIKVLRSIGERHPQLGEEVAGPSRRGILTTGAKFALGALVVGGALRNTPSAAAATAQGAGDMRRLHGAELALTVEKVTQIQNVRHILRDLGSLGYEGEAQLLSTSVAAMAPDKSTTTWLPLWNPSSSTLALVSHTSTIPNGARVVILEQVDGKVRPARNSPALYAPHVRPALDWGCLSECVYQICPWCAAACLFTGPLWAQCVVDCCGVGVLICYNIVC